MMAGQALTPPATFQAPATAPPDAVDGYFEISLFALLATGFLTLAGTGRLDLLTLLVMGVALGGRAVLLWRGSPFRLSPAWVFRLTVGYIPFFFFDILFLEADAPSLWEGVLLATVHLLFFTAVIKLFSAAQTRDYVYLAALAFAQMLAAATLTISTAFLLFFGLFLLLAISTFTSFEIRRARDRSEGPRPAIPSGGKRAGLAPALGMTSAIICCGVVMLSVLLFFVIPRANRGYFSALSRPSDRITGFSDDVELGQIGQIKRSTAVVMHVDAPELLPTDGVKWRGIGLIRFDGKRWYNERGATMAVPGRRSFRFGQPSIHPGRLARFLNYSITLQPVASDALFLAPQPLELVGPFRNLWQDVADSVYMPADSGALVRYTVLSDIAVPASDTLRLDNGPIPAAILADYTQLPPTDPRILALAEEIIAPHFSRYDKVRAVENYLKANYGYTLDLPPAMPDDPIAYFLFETRRGHCEFFASAMAVLLRAAGIPARLVNGFLQGQLNDISGQYTVRASDAHTWVEVYFPRHGWVSFDPTPAEGQLGQAHWMGRLALYLDAFQTFWQEWIINYDFVHQVTLARQLERSSRQFRSDSRQYFRQRYQNLLTALRSGTDNVLQHRALLAGLIVFLSLASAALFGRAALVAWIRELALRRRARTGKVRPQDATLLYLRLLRWLARRGVRKPPAQTPNEFAESVPEPARPLVRDFTRLYLETRFGGHTAALPRLSALLSQIQSQPFPGPRP